MSERPYRKDPAPWIPCAARLPERGVVVETAILDEYGSERNVQPMKLGAEPGRGSLWFIPDGSIYVYYAPTHWRPIDGK